MKELENIRDHVNYLRRFIPRSEWTRDDQRIVRLSAKIEAVLELHVPADFGECSECSNGTPYPCPTVTAIQEATT